MMRTSTPLSACTGPKLLRRPTSAITGTCTVNGVRGLSTTLCMAQPPGYFGQRHATQHDDRISQIFRRAAEAERRHQLGKVGQEKCANDRGDDTALGNTAQRVTADHDCRDGAEQIRKPA